MFGKKVAGDIQCVGAIFPTVVGELVARIVRRGESYVSQERLFISFLLLKKPDGCVCIHFGREFFSCEFRFRSIYPCGVVMVEVWRTVPVLFIRMHSTEIDVVALLKGTVECGFVRVPFSGGKGTVTVSSELLREGGMCFRNFHTIGLNVV